jgi:hypothetical protein
VRRKGTGDLGKMKVQALIQQMREEINNKD